MNRGELVSNLEGGIFRKEFTAGPQRVGRLAVLAFCWFPMWAGIKLYGHNKAGQEEPARLT